jgi:hypothetical protein
VSTHIEEARARMSWMPSNLWLHLFVAVIEESEMLQSIKDMLKGIAQKTVK